MKAARPDCEQRVLPQLTVYCCHLLASLFQLFVFAFLGMFTFAIAERLGERFLVLNQFRDSFRAPVFSAAAKVCEHRLYVAQFAHPLSHCTFPVLKKTKTERGSRDDRLWTMKWTGAEGSLPSLDGTFHTADGSLHVVAALLNIGRECQ